MMLQTPPFGGSLSTISPQRSFISIWGKRLLILAAIVLLIWAATNLFSCLSQQQIETPETEAPSASPSPFLETRLASYGSYENLTSKDLDALPNGTEISGFSLSTQEGAETPTMSSESASAIAAALKPFTDGDFKTGFMFMDIDTGRGFAYNIDEKIYGASSFKGPFCAYVAQNYIDEGQIKLSSVSDNLFNTIVYSSNSSYYKIRKNIDDGDLAKWLETLGIGSYVAYDTNYPAYTTRDSAKLWLAVYDYLHEDTAASKQLEKYFSRTDTSFIRRALNGSADDTLEKDADDADKGDGSGSIAVQDSEGADGGSEAIAVDEGDASSILIEIASGNSDMSITDTDSEYAKQGSIAVEYVSQDDGVSIMEYPFGNWADTTITETIENMGTSNVKVWDKAGWYPRDESDVPAMIDAGIIKCNGRDYLMCVMTDMPWSSPNRRTLENLIRTIFSMRENLA